MTWHRKPGPEDWQEDFDHENGQYINRCIQCECLFIGHKRRFVCKLCAKGVGDCYE